MTWTYEPGSSQLYIAILVTLAIGFAGFFAIMRLPLRFRKYVVGGFTFLAGAIYVLQWLWPSAQDRQPGDLPLNNVEAVSFWIDDVVVNVFKSLSNMLTNFLLLLGVASLVVLHVRRVGKQGKDWGFSLVLLVCVFLMSLFGYWDWLTTKDLKPEQLEAMKNVANQGVQNWMKDLMFDGMLQAMEAAMFSIIAFYILSAAFRAFRVRSVEATILLSSALLVMLSLLGIADTVWSSAVDKMGGTDPNALINNLRLDSIADFIRTSVQVPGLRAIDFGVGVGALAMALRLWLSLERGGTSS